jgi:hypothetical protein
MGMLPKNAQRQAHVLQNLPKEGIYFETKNHQNRQFGHPPHEAVVPGIYSAYVLLLPDWLCLAFFMGNILVLF